MALLSSKPASQQPTLNPSSAANSTSGAPPAQNDHTSPSRDPPARRPIAQETPTPTDPDALPYAPLPGAEEVSSTPSQKDSISSNNNGNSMARSSRYAHYDSDAHRLPAGFVRVAYDADRRVYTYRDSRGELWEGQPGNEYGHLHRVGAGADDAVERLESVWSEPMTDEEAASIERPMTVFPDTWDPPSDHETDELPTAKWFQAKSRLGFSTLRKSILRRNRRSGAGAGDSNSLEPDEKRSTERRSHELARNSSVAGWSMTSTLVSEQSRPRAKTVGFPHAGPDKEWL